MNFDLLAPGGGHVFTHVIAPDGELPVPSVDEHRQLDPAGTPPGEDGLQCRPSGSPGIRPSTPSLKTKPDFPQKQKRDIPKGCLFLLVMSGSRNYFVLAAPPFSLASFFASFFCFIASIPVLIPFPIAFLSAFAFSPIFPCMEDDPESSCP